MTATVKALKDPELSVNIVRATPLEYRDGKSDQKDRPEHVRAASGLAHFAEHLAVVQDDANFLALIEQDYHHTQSLPLPTGPQGKRQFSLDRGNIQHKLDLEACVGVPGNNLERLVAFGSGSDESREWVLLVDWDARGDHDIDLIDADRLYSYFRSEKTFCGSGLNIEGAVFVDENTLKLFQRGNSKPRGALDPVDATAEIAWDRVHAHLVNPEEVDPPELRNITQFKLGHLHDVPLTFSDGERVDGHTLFSASAEASEETDYIAGSVLGILNGDDCRWAEVKDLDGSAFKGKIEGLTTDPKNRRMAYFVIDDDNTEKPSKIFKAQLRGPWYD